MKLVPVSIDRVPLQQPLPYALRSETGKVLATRGYVIPSMAELEHLAALGVSLHIDEDDHPREFVHKLHALVAKDASLGDIANTRITNTDLTSSGSRQANDQPPPGWLDMLARTNALLRDPHKHTFMRLLDELHVDIRRHMLRSPDAALFALMHLTATEMQSYSALHAMLVCVMAELAGGQVLEWPEDEVVLTGKVALTMNISMTSLQDELTLQASPLTATQKHLIAVHAAYSAEVLKELGVSDEHWLDAVFHHQDPAPGPLNSRPLALRIARLIQRANVFAATMAPRVSREPLMPGQAMQTCYYDENHAPDEAGAALIKVVGIYWPGSYVRLASQEVAVVTRRGPNTTTPRVAVLINRQGMPTAEPMFRDTSQKDYRIIATVSHRDMKVKLPLERLLALV